MPSFDVVSEFDMHEVSNAVSQANKEVETRFDLKGTDSKFEHNETQIMLDAEVDFQLDGDGVEDVFRREVGVREIGDVDVFGQFDRQHGRQHGLATANFADDLDDAFARRDRVSERIEDVAALAAFVEQPGVWRDLEGRLRQTEMFVIHALNLTQPLDLRIQRGSVHTEQPCGFAQVAP